MFLTITPNSALDRVLFIDEFRAQTVMRTPQAIDSVGGKGFDTSVVLRALGKKTTALGFVAGRVGQELVTLLDGYGIDHDLIWVAGDTRIAHVIVEKRHNRHSHIISGQLELKANDADALLEQVKIHLPQSQWVICAGSVPAELDVDLYAQIVILARKAGKPSLVDSHGPGLEQAAKARPTILKMNREEMGETFGVIDETLVQMAQAACTLQADLDLNHVVITCGRDGIVALNHEDAWHAVAPLQQAVNAAGAGDAVSAALVVRLSAGDSWENALRWAAATSAAVVLTPGTADCHMKDILRIFQETVVRRL
jgi:1-phosphofructokinase family hexose kinase